MIYFVEAVGVGLIKIGVTGSLPERMRTLRAMSPVPLRCLGVMEGGIAEEEYMHGIFGHVCSHDEWFWPVPPLKRFITDNARPVDEEELVLPLKRRQCPDKTTLYCPDGFAEWLRTFASSQGMSVTGIIDEAARHWAERHSHRMPPPLPEHVLTVAHNRHAKNTNHVMIPATAEWRGWFNDVADKTGRDVNKVMRAVLKAHAENIGYPLLAS
jgi:hypothetical protein